MGLKKTTNKVLLIGWDAADWKIIHQFIDTGKMPNMAKFVEQGVIGNLATLYPALSPMLWTSIATGKRPFKHGIRGFIEPDPHSGGVRPITNISRKTKAIWNILGQSGKKSNVIGWWPSHPAEPINGVMVSNHYQRAIAPHGEPWPVRPGTVHPERLIGNLAALRVHPQELDTGLIMNFVPRLAEIDQEKNHRIENLAKIIADCTTINKAATAIMHHEQWDFTAVYFDSIDHFCHGFINYHPPRLPWVNEKDYELYKHIVESGYIYHDIMLGTLLDKAGDDSTVMLVSDHGFHSDHLRPRHIPVEPAGPAVQHRPCGIFAIKGPGIKKDEIIYGASLLDICPTVLTLFGLPVGEDMDGKPLVNIFERPPKIKTISNWDIIPGNDGSHPEDRKIDPVEAKEAINQLVELGYIEKPDENREKAARHSLCELDYNVARSYMDAGLYVEAVPILKDLLETWPDQHRFGTQLVTCLQALGRVTEARSLLDEIFRRKREGVVKSTRELKEFSKKHKDTRPGDFTAEEQRKLRELRTKASGNPYAMEFLMGSLLFEEGDEDQALVHLKIAEKADNRQAALHNRLGDVYLKIKRRKDAEDSFERALAIDSENADAHLGLCQTYLQMKNSSAAAEAALTATGLRFHNPKGHFLLGVALHRMGRVYEAINALKLAISQSPNYPEAHRRLSYIYKNRLKDDAKAEKYNRLAKEAKKRIYALKKGEPIPGLDKETAARTSITSDQAGVSSSEDTVPQGPMDLKNTVVIVSGLPRSGTSMMMQMLTQGGLAALTDNTRKADEDNPRGYFEFQKAKQLQKDTSWLSNAKGGAVKIIAQLLRRLPGKEGLDYRVVFMERNLDEVTGSQGSMLKRQGKRPAKLSDEGLRKIFSEQIRQIKRMLSARDIPTLSVDYNRALAVPAETAGRINAFLGGWLDEKKMAEAVEPLLKRQGRKEVKGRGGR